MLFLVQLFLVLSVVVVAVVTVGCYCGGVFVACDQCC